MLTALLLAGATSLASPATAACDKIAVIPAESRAPATPAKVAPRIQKLGELPKPVHELTVLRRVDGCVKPVIVRDTSGGLSRAGAKSQHN